MDIGIGLDSMSEFGKAWPRRLGKDARWQFIDPLKLDPDDGLPADSDQPVGTVLVLRGEDAK
jgi:hypothetical protein